MPLTFVAQGPMLVPTGYVGVGDLVSTPLSVYFGLRAYSRATCGQPCCAIFSGGFSQGATINTLANGQIDIAAVDAFQAAFGVANFRMYDQINNTSCTSPGGGVTLAWTPADPLSPYADFSLNTETFTNTSGNVAGFTMVAKVTGSLTSEQVFGDAGNFVNNRIGFNDGGTHDNTWYISDDGAGGILRGAATDNVFHAAQANYTATTACSLYIDGVNNTGVIAGNIQSSVRYAAGATHIATFNFVGGMREWCVYADDQSANFAAVNANQRAYWGF